jgi:hypothetical protein
MSFIKVEALTDQSEVYPTTYELYVSWINFRDRKHVDCRVGDMITLWDILHYMNIRTLY